ncbi:hypothetical protein [Salinisphaera orenii]|uniref:hypothetical protein n=1 Tax=Salinisphaera orenii TaxID=856731 RepID=UPI0019550BD7
MTMRELTAAQWGKAAGLGLLNGIALAIIMVAALKSGVSPLPKPLALAFVDTLTGQKMPLPLGLVFHLAYVTFWTMVYVAWAYPRFGVGKALALGLALWLFLLVVFLPVVGWGFLGLAVGPKLILVFLINHLLFAGFAWALCRGWGFRRAAGAS